MNKQRGITFVGMVLLAIVVVIVAVIGLKIVPAYIDYFTIKKELSEMVHDPDLRNASVAEIRSSFDRRASIDSITEVAGSDIDVSREGGGLTLTTSYSQKIHLFGNVSLYIDFVASAG